MTNIINKGAIKTSLSQDFAFTVVFFAAENPPPFVIFSPKNPAPPENHKKTSNFVQNLLVILWGGGVLVAVKAKSGDRDVLMAPLFIILVNILLKN